MILVCELDSFPHQTLEECFSCELSQFQVLACPPENNDKFQMQNQSRNYSVITLNGRGTLFQK